MSTQFILERRKSHNNMATIVPMVSKLINSCKANGKEFRIMTEQEHELEGRIVPPVKPDNGRMTIVVNKDTGALVKNYWG